MSNSDQEQNPVPGSLAEVQELIKLKAQELLFCQPPAVPQLQREIQKLRIVAALFREIETGHSDDDLYKEMNLLSRMTVGKDLEQEFERKEADAAIAASSEKLRKNYGVNQQQANRIARVLTTVVGGMKLDGPADIGDDEPKPVDPNTLQ